MKLDDGFENLYARIKEGLEENKELYKEVGNLEIENYDSSNMIQFFLLELTVLIPLT